MTQSKKQLSAVFAVLLFLSGCELVDAFEATVSGPRCGAFGEPPGFEEKMIAVDEPNRNDKAIALLEEYEHTRNPELLFGLAYAYLIRSGEQGQDPSLNRRAVELFTLSALCGEGRAASLLASVYSEGLTGVEKKPVLGACLEEVYDPALYERALIPGRVWACGVRMENFEE